MKRRRILLLLALVVVAMACVLFWPRGPAEPVYQGRKLSEWLEDSFQGQEAETRRAAEQAVQRMDAARTSLRYAALQQHSFAESGSTMFRKIRDVRRP